MPATSATTLDRFTLPDADGHFGRYGGVFVPETLMTALGELGTAYAVARKYPGFQAELRQQIGRSGRRTVETAYSSKIVAPRVADVFRSVARIGTET